MNTFINTPDKPKTTVTKPKSLNVTTVNHYPWWAWVTLSVTLLVLIYIGFILFTTGRELLNTKKEMLFAVQHPDLVKPMREMYELSHKRADAEVKSVLLGK